MKPPKIKLSSLLITFLLALSIPFLTKFTQNAQKFFIKARASPANIRVDTAKIVGPVPKSWKALAQGGEEATPTTLSAVIPEVASLNPEYIRIDHIYDFYDVVSKNEDSSLNYNFEKLDIVVSDILSTGSKPFFALSYMPPAFSRDGLVTSLPNNWPNWQTLVQRTIEHYSGRDGLNIDGVYYEVWNEPDLFGRWEIGRGEKDYLLLYTYAARGAREAQNTNQFFFGGPATTGAYPNWFRTLIDYTNRSNLPLDFISWHYYGADIAKFNRDIDMVDAVIAQYPGRQIQKIVSEWGIDSENNPAYDNLLSATHTLASLKTVGSRLNFAFVFEIKDGIDPAGKGLWGRWGILGHEIYGKIEKPRYKGLQMLSSLSGNLVEVTGGGTFVDAIATKEENSVKLLLYNFDLTGGNYEAVPITFTNLEQGTYQLSSYSLVSKTPVNLDLAVDTGSLSYTVILTPNDIALVEIRKVSHLFQFTQGRSSDPLDQSLELSGSIEPPTFDISSSSESLSTISFWFKPYWSGGDDTIDYTLLNLIGAGGQTLSLKANKIGFTPSLKFSLSIGSSEVEQSVISIPIRDWIVNSWHQISVSFGEGRLYLQVDGQNIEKQINIVLLPINQLEPGQANGAIDDLEVKSDKEIILQKKFDGSLN